MPRLWVLQPDPRPAVFRRGAAGKMATRVTDRSLGVPARAHYLEVVKLKLAKEHFPLPVVLRKRILADYPTAAPLNETMDAEPGQLIDALAGCSDPAVSLRDAVGRRLADMAIEVTPTGEQLAILAWLDEAHRDWLSRYALAKPLAEQLQKLRPLAAALALTDEDFMRPGAHPLHQLLDNVITTGIGWEPEVARSENFQSLVIQATESSLAWFEDPGTDLATIHARFARESNRERIRAQRMAQRSVETEEGRVKTARARRLAAKTINDCLADHPVTPAIGDFLRGPWYESAQLVLLKFGEGSRQWEAMSKTTLGLLQSLQPLAEASSERKQEMFELVTTLPKEIKRWLLSLHHDDQAVEECVGIIEFAHLKILRKEELEQETAGPIATTDSVPPPDEHAEKLRTLQPGQWFSIRQGEPKARRLRLSLNLRQQQQLLFTDHAGLKAMQLDYGDFGKLLAERRIEKLPHEVSYSECLARAAGIDSVEALQQLIARSDIKEEKAPDLPMGAWLGFHDGETPLLAKLAVHDQDRDMYIFVNREGIKLREVSRPALRSLMDQGLAEMLESRSSFQEQVNRAKAQQPESGEEE